jgi:hypothetical protein
MENIPLPVNNPAVIIRIVIFKKDSKCSFQRTWLFLKIIVFDDR